MEVDLTAVKLDQIIFKLCAQLSHERKVITTKKIINMINESHPKMHDYDYTESLITKKINLWRLTKINLKSQGLIKIKHPEIFSADSTSSYNRILQKNTMYKHKIIKFKRELQYLKAKIHALKSFYNRQRKELIMKIEGMLYKR